MPEHDFERLLNFRGGDGIKWNTYPPEVLPMWVADTDFACPAPVLEALEERVRQGAFGYSEQEQPDPEKAAAHWMRTRFAWNADPQWVAFSPSVVASLTAIILTFTQPGEHVLFMTPAYPPFFSVPLIQGRQPLTSPLTLEETGGYAINFEDLEQKMSLSSCRLLVLCNPHNPTGRVFSREELLRIGDLCLKHNLLIFSDEIHCDFVFPGHTHVPFPSLSPALARQSLSAINPSKTFNMADMHASVIFCPNPGLLARFKTTGNALAFRRTALGCLALKTAYRECAWYVDQEVAYIKANMDMAIASIQAHIPSIRAWMPEATYLLWLDCREMGLKQSELVHFFLKKAKLALGSGTDYGADGTGFMRMNLACRRDTLKEALARLTTAVSTEYST